jgi:hypothetical protein
LFSKYSELEEESYFLYISIIIENGIEQKELISAHKKIRGDV